MELPVIGAIVRYVSPTRHGPVILPAQVLGHQDEGQKLMVFFDDAGDSEMIVLARYDAGRSPKTWHSPEHERTNQ